MKQITITAARIVLVLVLYVCCSSVVCSGSKHVTVTTDATTYDNGNSRGDNKITEENISPNQLISIRLIEFL